MTNSSKTMNKLTKYLTTAGMVIAPIVSSAQEKANDLYTKFAFFGKHVNQEQMYGLEASATQPIGKNFNVELASKYSHNMKKTKPISNMEFGLYPNLTTGNNKKTSLSIGPGIKWQSRFLQNRDNPKENKNIDFFELALRLQAEGRLSKNAYIHAGWEYGFDSKEQIGSLGLRFLF